MTKSIGGARECTNVARNARNVVLRRRRSWMSGVEEIGILNIGAIAKSATVAPDCLAVAVRSGAVRVLALHICIVSLSS